MTKTNDYEKLCIDQKDQITRLQKEIEQLRTKIVFLIETIDDKSTKIAKLESELQMHKYPVT